MSKLSSFIHLQKQAKQRWYLPLTVLVGLLITLSLFSLLMGSSGRFDLFSLTDLQEQLILQLRLPRLVAAICVGAALGVSGAALQILLGNSLAEPGIIGISGGASLAMVIALFAFPWLVSPIGNMLVAMCGALVFTFILVSFAKRYKLNTSRLLLVGVAFGILTSSVITWAFYFSDDLNARMLMYWLMGSISGSSWEQVILAGAMLPCLIMLCRLGDKLNTLMAGELHAMQLGLDVERLRWVIIAFIAVLVGGSVAIGGIIGFVGLVVPHWVRLWFGSDNRYVLPMSGLLGASLLVFADLIARMSLASAELPLGAVTATIGAPFFVWMLLKKHD